MEEEGVVVRADPHLGFRKSCNNGTSLNPNKEGGSGTRYAPDKP